MSDVGERYAEGRRAVTGLVRGLDAPGQAARIPACPDWTVKDLVAHLSGICSDILNGRLDGVATDPWTRAQVDARRDWTIGKVIEEWSELGPQLESLTDALPPHPAEQLVADLTTHEHDIRGALGAPGGRDSQRLRKAAWWMAARLDDVARARGAPATRIVTEDGELAVGAGAQSASAKTDLFELFRALTGRRSADQIASWSWDGDPRAFCDLFPWGPFTLASGPVPE